MSDSILIFLIAISTATSTNGLSNEGYKYYNQPRNCADIKTMQVGESSSGTYTIYPMPSVPVPVDEKHINYFSIHTKFILPLLTDYP